MDPEQIQQQYQDTVAAAEATYQAAIAAAKAAYEAVEAPAREARNATCDAARVLCEEEKRSYWLAQSEA